MECNGSMRRLRATAPEFMLARPSGIDKKPHASAQTSLSASATEFAPTLGLSHQIRTALTSKEGLTPEHSSESLLDPKANEFCTQQGIDIKGAETNRVSINALNASAVSFMAPRHVDSAETMPANKETFKAQKKPICRYFQQGACSRGLQCAFSHEISNQDKAVVHDDIRLIKEYAEAESGEYRVVDNGIRCQFGPGIKVLKVLLGSEDESVATKQCSRVLIGGLITSITDYDLEARLSTFGKIESITRKHETHAYCTFFQSQSALDAAVALNGTPSTTWLGLAKKEIEQVDPNVGAKQDGFISVSVQSLSNLSVSDLRNATVKLQWFAPSRIAWIHFHGRQAAEKAAQKAHEKMFDRRVVSAKFQRPSFGQTQSFSLWLGGLGEHVDKKQLGQFIRKQSGSMPDSIKLEQPTFHDKDGARIVRELLLAKGGPLVHFEEDMDNTRFPYSPKRKALAKFTKEEDAARICNYFCQNTRVTGLGDTRVYCQRVYSAKFTLPSSIFVVVKDELKLAVQAQQANTAPDLRFKIFENQNMTSSMLLQADYAKNLALAKNRISPIVDGEVLLDPCCKQGQKVPLWKDFFASKAVVVSINNGIDQKFGYQYVHLLFLNRRREVRVFARPFLLDKVVDYATKLLCSFKPDSLAVPIGPDQYKFLLSGGRDTLGQLISSSHVESVSLDLKSHSLLVEGSARDAKRTIACLTRMMCNKETTTLAETDGAETCPVCFCTPGEDDGGAVVQLSCFHRYCKGCFHAWLCGGSQTLDFPIRCIAENCAKHVEPDELSAVLPRPDFLSLLRSALDKYVVSNLSEYQFCISPGCNGIYSRPASSQQQDSSTFSSLTSRTSTCSTCQMTICCRCKIQEHEGLTCEQYMLNKLPPNRLRNHIVEEILTLKCPRCSQAFLAFDGCFALTCSACPCGFCGWCLKDCGRDAHEHVKSCPEKVKGAEHETYFGTFGQFEEAQRNRRRKKLVSFLKTLDEEEQRSVLKAIQQDTKDLQLGDISIPSLRG